MGSQKGRETPDIIMTTLCHISSNRQLSTCMLGVWHMMCMHIPSYVQLDSKKVSDKQTVDGQCMNTAV